MARLFGLKVNVLTRSWRAGFQENGSLWDQALAVSAYDDANIGGGAGARGKKRQRLRGDESASNRARSANVGGFDAAAAGRGSGGGARGSRGGASGGGGDAFGIDGLDDNYGAAASPTGPIRDTLRLGLLNTTSHAQEGAAVVAAADGS